MHSAQRAFEAAEGIVDLDDSVVEVVSLIFALAEEPGEKSAVVAAFLQFNDESAF
jgi:hypothetical protein